MVKGDLEASNFLSGVAEVIKCSEWTVRGEESRGLEAERKSVLFSFEEELSQETIVYEELGSDCT